MFQVTDLIIIWWGFQILSKRLLWIDTWSFQNTQEELVVPSQKKTQFLSIYSQYPF